MSMSVVDSAVQKLPRSAAGRHNPWLVAVIASIATFMEVMDTTVVTVSLYHISAGLGVSYNEALWVVTCYIIANALVVPISGWLAQVIGRKRYYMCSVALFTLSSLLCSLSPNLACLIAARILQGIGGGGLAPVEQSMIVDSFPLKKRAQAFALYGMTVLLAPAIGPLFGGYITDILSWHWIFLINIPIGLFSLLLCHQMISEPRVLIKERLQCWRAGIKIDVIGLLLIIIGLGSLQLCLDRFEIYNGFSSYFIVVTAILAGVTLSFLPVWEYFHPQPIIDFRLFRFRNFFLGTVMMFLIGLVLVGTTQILPQMSQELMGYDALTAGLTLATGGLFVIFSMMFTGSIASRLQSPQWLTVIAFIGIATAMHHFSRLNLNADFATLMWARVLQMIWLPLILIPISTLSYVGLPASASSQASAIATLLRNLGGCIGIAWMANLLHQRTHLHYERLGEHLTSNTLHLVSDVEKLASLLYSQARIMSFLDIYTVMMYVAIIVSPLPLLFIRLKKDHK